MRRLYRLTLCHLLLSWSLSLFVISNIQMSVGASKRNKALIREMFEVSRRPRVSPWWSESMQALPVLKQRVVTHNNGRDVSFRCHAFGHPQPKATWYKNGRKIHGIKREVWQHRWRLVLPGVTWQDTGIYSCNARNRFGEISRHFALDVRSRLRRHWYPDELEVRRHRNITVRAGDTAILRCGRRARRTMHRGDRGPNSFDQHGMNESNILWIRGKLQHLLASYDNINIYLRPSSMGELILTSTHLNDSGYYTCLTSELSGLIYHSIWLQVLQRSAFNTAMAEASTIDLFSSPSFEVSEKIATSMQPLIAIKYAYIRGVTLAVAGSCIIVIFALVGFFVAGIMQARRREDVVLGLYNLK